MLRTDCTKKLERYLAREGVAFRELTHTTAYTAQRLAGVAEEHEFRHLLRPPGSLNR